MNEKLKNTKGITLIALIITIIILIILAAVTLATISGQNGTLSKSGEAVVRTQIGTAQDKCTLIAADMVTDYYYNVYIEGAGAYSSNTLDNQILEEICNSEEITALGITAERVTETDDSIDASFTLTYSDTSSITGTISNGKITWGTVEVASTDESSAVETISTEESYVGYYADVDGNGTVDGVIYADLMDSDNASGTWGTIYGGSYAYEVISSAKDYYVIQEDYEGDFGTADVLAATGSGTERFYVMALEDVDDDMHLWYGSAVDNLTNYASAAPGEFGKGKYNTYSMITLWNSGDPGTQNGISSCTDMWGLDAVQIGYASGWFIPSIDEWVCFRMCFRRLFDKYR